MFELMWRHPTAIPAHQDNKGMKTDTFIADLTGLLYKF
jgi:hypothetical protein